MDVTLSNKRQDWLETADRGRHLKLQDSTGHHIFNTTNVASNSNNTSNVNFTTFNNTLKYRKCGAAHSACPPSELGGVCLDTCSTCHV